MDSQKLCCIDCSETFHSRLNTGIQRVVRNLISRLDSVDTGRGYRFVPVVSVGDRLYQINNDFSDSFMATHYTTRLFGFLRKVLDCLLLREMISSESEIADQEIVAHEAKVKFEKISLHNDLLKIFRRIMPYFFVLPRYIDLLLNYKKRIEFKRGDVLLVADCFWNVDTCNAAVRAKQDNASLIIVMYDIIPITHPSLVDDGNTLSFVNCLNRLLPIADGFISISKFTENEFTHYCNAMMPNNDMLFDNFYLGADFIKNVFLPKVDSSLSNDLADGNFFLMVGTIEPRKNHLYVIDAFEYLWSRGHDVKLCIVGKVGWKCDAVLERIRNSRYAGTKLLYYSKLGDKELCFCYNLSKAVILSSIVEGFGLPLIEAMHFNKMVLASDIPVFREIGGDYPIYFSLNDDKSLIEAILLTEKRENVRDNATHAWISWDESAKSLLDKVTTMAESILARSARSVTTEGGTPAGVVCESLD